MAKVEIESKQERADIRLAGATIATARQTVRLRESGLPERVYIPKAAFADGVSLTATRGARCPHKGDWHYYDLRYEGQTVTNAAWEYYAPLESCAAITDHVAFDLDKVEVWIDGRRYQPS
ncbi:MAG: DUF427 domain-containing protein [Myxococcales bacterium]|nr:DUF427 domain-containing protein [Myxococcales bacterium]MCB9755416.1 DUF427 domain-containing protein [Myxococcales bacterium]